MRARADYRAHLGKTLLASEVRTLNEEDAHIWVICEPPARVRVTATPDSHVARSDGEWVAPYWVVELMNPHSAISKHAQRLLDVDGFSYEIATRRRHNLDTWIVAPEPS